MGREQLLTKPKLGKNIFGANIMADSDILLIFHVYIFGQKYFAPKVERAPMPMGRIIEWKQKQE